MQLCGHVCAWEPDLPAAVDELHADAQGQTGVATTSMFQLELSCALLRNMPMQGPILEHGGLHVVQAACLDWLVPFSCSEIALDMQREEHASWLQLCGHIRAALCPQTHLLLLKFGCCCCCCTAGFLAGSDHGGAVYCWSRDAHTAVDGCSFCHCCRHRVGLVWGDQSQLAGSGLHGCCRGLRGHQSCPDTSGLGGPGLPSRCVASFPCQLATSLHP